MHIHRNPKKLETLDDSLFWFRNETFYNRFEFKVFRHEERERDTHNFLLCWLFHKTPPRATHFVDPKWSRLGETKNRLDSSKPKSQLTVFFSNPRILSSSLPGMTSFTSLVPFHIWGFYCDICDCHIRPGARVNNCTQYVHLTNPCTKPKGSQPN